MIVGGASVVCLAGTDSSEDDDTLVADAMSALLNLGYNRVEAHAALLRARQKTTDNGDKNDVSSLIAVALQEMGS